LGGVQARAGLKDVRTHDLRHTFASTTVAAGQGLPMIGKMPGHTQVQTNARYARLAADPVKTAAYQFRRVLRPHLIGWRDRCCMWPPPGSRMQI
jgi:site-specific recombinase XerD